MLLRSDGRIVACGSNRFGQCNIPEPGEGVVYAQVAAGCHHTVLLRSDGRITACGSDSLGHSCGGLAGYMAISPEVCGGVLPLHSETTPARTSMLHCSIGVPEPGRATSWNAFFRCLSNSGQVANSTDVGPTSAILDKACPNSARFGRKAAKLDQHVFRFRTTLV